MLRIVEIGTALDLTNARTKEKENNDYLYILKYNNTFLLIDNGTEHYMSGIMEYTQEQYDALTTVHNNVLYMVSNIIDNSTSYSIYYGNTKIDAHEHLNKEILDKFSESVDGKLLYNGALIEGSGGSADLTEIQEQIDDINLRSMIGEELDYGYFTMSSNQTINSPIVKTYIKIDTVKISNGIVFNHDTYMITLKKGKTYNIEYSVTSKATSWDTYHLLNINKNEYIGGSLSIIPSTSAINTGSHLPTKSEIFQPTEDTNIALVLSGFNGTSLIVNNAYIIVQEIGRTHIVDPMDVKDKYEVEYGQYNSSNTTVTLNTNIFLKKLNGNMGINENGTVSLKNGKTYKVELMARPTSESGWANISLVNSLDNSLNGIGQACVWTCMSANLETTFSNRSGEYIIEPTADINVCLRCVGTSVSGLKFEINSLVFYEIAQPVVVEYNNNREISNPLTTTDISQESPVGSVINHIGIDPLDHYLACDGGIYNIVDYPHLAKYILNIYGIYNYFGGDGVTTFAVPDLTKNYESKQLVSIPLAMTSNTNPSPYVASASSVYTMSYEAWRAFDGTPGDGGWLTDQYTSTGWVQINFGKRVSICAFELTARTNPYYPQYINAPKNFTLEASNDGTTFTIIKTYTNETWTRSQTKRYILSANISYQYYRINISASTAEGGVYTAIGQLKFLRYISPCVKYEPTYYAVNQYGGFESTEVYLGAHSTVGTITLSDNISDYDYMVIETLNSNNQTNYHTQAPSLEKDFIVTEIDKYINFKFTDDVTLQVTEIGGLSLVSIRLIKGQLPTLLQGGEF